MYINHDDIVTLASNPTAESDQLLSSMDREVVALMSQVRTAQRVRQKERERAGKGEGSTGNKKSKLFVNGKRIP